MRISHYSIIVVVVIFYLKPLVNIIHKKHWRLLFKSSKENIIYKIIHGKNYEELYKLIFKAHGN